MVKEFKDDNGIPIKDGRIIQFTWFGDSCWGKEGTYEGYARIREGLNELIFINRPSHTRTEEQWYNNTGYIEELESLLNWSEDIEVIGTINI